MPSVQAIFFDAYGTLFDIHAPAAAMKARLGPIAQQVSQLWRQKQLEYTWTLSLRRQYRSFWELTAEALDVALATYGLDQDRQQRDSLLAAYRQLSAYPEVPPLLQKLKAAGIPRTLLSNGDPDLLSDLTAAAKLGDLLDAPISVAEVGVYKPDARGYQLALDRFKLSSPQSCAFVSSNAWDAAGAAQFGFRTFWINRNGQPIEYGLDRQATILSSLGDLAHELIDQGAFGGR
ncbi:haloacid dehalogenase type II [Dongia soli]|uniref:(S)-2-haloacid dehalogenase n=1 Tax=Dongia soli TaxID=600628 RepID=A0ABU5EF34_9PROT|nr:haloacid dehalogenase type II [Dongia soli]MDY0885014.1 haloacid dehalogenase type II [Dongia soli]